MRSTEELLALPPAFAAAITNSIRTLQAASLLHEHDKLKETLKKITSHDVDKVLAEMLLLPAKLVVALATKMGPHLLPAAQTIMDLAVTALLDDAIKAAMPTWSFTLLEQSGLAQSFVSHPLYAQARNLAVAALAARYEAAERGVACDD